MPARPAATTARPGDQGRQDTGKAGFEQVPHYLGVALLSEHGRLSGTSSGLARGRMPEEVHRESR